MIFPPNLSLSCQSKKIQIRNLYIDNDSTVSTKQMLVPKLLSGYIHLVLVQSRHPPIKGKLAETCSCNSDRDTTSHGIFNVEETEGIFSSEAEVVIFLLT